MFLAAKYAFKRIVCGFLIIPETIDRTNNPTFKYVQMFTQLHCTKCTNSPMYAKWLLMKSLTTIHQYKQSNVSHVVEH